MKTLFAFRGRIARGSFWRTQLTLGAAFLVLFVFLEEMLGRASTLALYPFFFWIAAAAAVKRLRDRGKPPAWLVIALVPVLGPLWLLVELGFLRGTPGENQYGPDPREHDADYLTVDIHRP
jgi:uncharacterized membrane protein YhaH (DUF805 family)